VVTIPTVLAVACQSFHSQEDWAPKAELNGAVLLLSTTLCTGTRTRTVADLVQPPRFQAPMKGLFWRVPPLTCRNQSGVAEIYRLRVIVQYVPQKHRELNINVFMQYHNIPRKKATTRSSTILQPNECRGGHDWTCSHHRELAVTDRPFRCSLPTSSAP
jgi:hypothetical protein